MGSVYKSSVYDIIKYFMQKKYAGRLQTLRKWDVLGNLLCSIEIDNRGGRVLAYYQINSSTLTKFLPQCLYSSSTITFYLFNNKIHQSQLGDYVVHYSYDSFSMHSF